jgi:hypothetical protein
MQERPAPRHHLRLEQSPLERARLWVEIAAFVAAGCWAVYTFVYQTRIAPLFLPPHERIAIDARRLAETPSNYLERIEVTIYNDGKVDVDTAAVAISVYGAKRGSDLALQSRSAKDEIVSREIPLSSWTPVAGYGMLLDGATNGHPHEHFILRPGDNSSVMRLVVVPRTYNVLYLRFQTIFDRYPITPRIPVRLQNSNGAVTLVSSGVSIDTEAYFGV